MILSPHEIAWLAVNVGQWSGGDARVAVAVALAESRGETDALGRSTTGTSVGQRDHGLWQISGRWHGALLAQHRWRDPFDNCRMARSVYVAAGWTAWTTYQSSTYMQWLADATFGLASPVEPDTSQRWRRMPVIR